MNCIRKGKVIFSQILWEDICNYFEWDFEWVIFEDWERKNRVSTTHSGR